MKYIYLSFAAIFLLIGNIFSQNITYTVSSADIFNPERGIYQQFNCPSSEIWALPGFDWLIDPMVANNQSLCLRMYVFDAFRDSPLTEDYLNVIRGDFDHMKTKGIKCILRFCYNNANFRGGDASKAIVMQHIAQLKPVLQENADLIFCIQAGFIGDCGEWHSSTNSADWDNDNYRVNRREMVDALLDALPSNRMVQLRTPGQKQSLYQQEPLTDAQGFDQSNIARIGFHNDCFLSSVSDVGTYYDTLAQRYYYMNPETKFVPTGGEMCAGGGEICCEESYSYCYHQKMNCSYGIREMELLHWTYLVDFSWTCRFIECYDEIKKRLGYRFSLLNAIFPPTATQGGNYSFDIKLQNTGFASLINPRQAHIIFQNATDSAVEYKLSLTADPRSWLPGVHHLAETIKLPADMPIGKYKLFLFLPDASNRLANLPAYSIQMANENVWEPQTGYNNLHFEMVLKSDTSAENEKKTENNVIIYPNPVFKDYLYIVFKEKLADKTMIEIAGSDGKIVLIKNAVNNIEKLNIATLPVGIYFLRIIADNKTIKFHKFVIQ